MSRLFKPFEFHGVTARNHMRTSPICQFTASSGGSNADWPDDWHKIHYGARAAGGVGTVIVEATAICLEDRISPLCLMLNCDEKIPGFAWLATLIKEDRALAGIQISHAGREASSSPSGTPLMPANDEMGGIGQHPVVPSPIPFSSCHEVLWELDLPGIRTIQNQSVQAVHRALGAGSDFVELHGAYGYLMHEFPLSIANHCIDGYGGDLEGRLRFWEEIIVAIRAKLGSSSLLLVRTSTTSWLPESNLELRRDVTLDDWGKLARELPRLGVGFIDVSAGGCLPYTFSSPRD